MISLILIPARINLLKSCAWGYDSRIEDITLFDIDKKYTHKFEVFLPTMFDYVLFNYGSEGNEDSLNITECQKYFGSVFTFEQLSEYIYKTDINGLDRLIENNSSQKIKSAAEYWKLLRDSTLMYRRIDENYYWNPDNVITKDSATYNKVIETCKQKFKAEKDPFVKQRYAYLTLRALRFNHRYDECIDWYSTNLATGELKGTLKYRSLQYFAGALYHREKIAEANYLFSRIFDEYPPRGGQAAFDFHPMEQADWNQAIALAKNNREKETLYFLLGRWDPLNALDQIVKLNPESEYIPPLLVRLVNNIEDVTREVYRNGIATTFTWYEPEGSFYSADGNCYACLYGSDRMNKSGEILLAKNFINRMSEGNSYTGLWTTASAYIDLLLKDNVGAGKMIDRANTILKSDSSIAAELKYLQTIHFINTTQHIDSVAEEKLWKLMTQPELNRAHPLEWSGIIASPVNRYCMQLIADKYAMQNDSLKAELCSRTSHLYYQDDAFNKLRAMDYFMVWKKRSRWEEYMKANYEYNYRQIRESLGVLHLYNHEFEDAFNTFNSISCGDQVLYGDPFLIHIVDCHDCDFDLPQKKTYNQRTFAEQMVKLRKYFLLEWGPEMQSKNYFEYANGLYNMSYAGNARVLSECMITNMARDGTYFLDGEKMTAKYSGFYGEFYKKYWDCSEAESYYKKAYDLTRDKEMKAQCMWMMAKCQLFNFYSTDEFDYGTKDFIAFDAYRSLDSLYKGTKYYDEVIKECEYFAKYAARD